MLVIFMPPRLCPRENEKYWKLPRSEKFVALSEFNPGAFDGIAALLLAAIPTELSRLLGWSCATHAVFYGDNIQRMIVVTLAEKQLCNEQG